MNEKLEVRLANKADVDDIIELGLMMTRETGVGDLNIEKVRVKLSQAVDRTPNDPRFPAICGVIGDPGHLTGMIFLEVGTLWYNDDWGLHEMWNFVHPKYRVSNRARYLINFAKGCAKKLHVPLHIGVISNQRTSAKVALYTRILGTGAIAGTFFLWNGHTGAA